MTSQGSTFGSLIAAKNLIGRSQGSGISTPIQHSAVTVDKNNVLIFTTLGLGAITSAFEEAAMIYTHTSGYFGPKKRAVARQALAFIQGTGLEIAIKTYGLLYDADEMRANFYRIFHVKINS